ncbi:PREDICTED: proline-rich receptor-like protein kinase PERK12 [Camelina sativa]|uniref:non-specific serine/threonine protein kinase n=1 Tax=Camelina sativa TaxID=90675 RepID=A0ABM0VRN0_CAMSA|nr:PREDICTED: proline-rich receptor-like protein kinase PERK12 [Camelina sativa]
MSDLDDSPSLSPPAPPADTAPPPDTSSGNSAPPPDDSSPPTPPANSSPPPPSEPSPPPPDSELPPLPSIFPPVTASPPPPSDSSSPPSDSTPSPPPPSPPADSETPPAPPNDSDNNNPPPSSPDVQSPPPSSSSPNVDPTRPGSPPSQSPPAPPSSDPTNSPPAPPLDPTKPPPIQPSGPANSPPANPNSPPSPFLNAPPKTVSNGPIASPSLNAPSKGTPSSNQGSGDGGYQGKTVVGMAVAGFAILALIAVVFLVRRKKKRKSDSYNNTQYMPHPNFSVKSDGFLYGQDPGKGYSSGPGGSMYNSQQQQQSSMGNSFGAPGGYPHHQMQSGGTPDSAILGTGQTHFSYDELASITQGFSRQNILGEGGFGCVYKGTLQDGKVVAVKQLKAGSGQGDREFKAEVEIISRVHHRHLVSLVGYCISDQHRLLIYEYVSNQTLEHHLHGKGMPVLEWSKRVRIAIGSAKGLAYLHEDCHPKIIHRDIKSANILLDDEYEAQVADFGLARLNDTTQTHVSTRVMGTFGYLAPEYASSGKLTDRSDVFSFGVVLLELVTGRKPVDQSQPLGEESLVEWARPLLLKAIETGDFSELVDRRLEKHYVEHEVFRMIEAAAACVRHSGPKRPRMVQVVRALDCDGDSGDISNGIKVGQSTAYDSGQYNEEIMKFRKMAFGFDNNTESRLYSGDYSAKSSADFSGNESETRPFNNRRF